MASHLLLLAALLLTPAASAGELSETLGRTQTEVRSGPTPFPVGVTVQQALLPERLDQLGYRRVKERPTEPGTWFWGSGTVWVYRRAYRWNNNSHSAELIGLTVSNKQISGVVNEAGNPQPTSGRNAPMLEPLVLAESLDEARAPRILVEFSDLPEHVWRPLLALEDDRFFEHHGVSGRAIARAALANARAGRTVQGGSTITQQLIKNRDLTAKRSLDRKASEAIRSLAIEAEYDKEEILEAYLNTVYYGHVDGVAVYGIGRASRVYFNTSAEKLTLEQAASLAAIVQGPNALSPLKHPDRNRARRDHALDRMVELEWATAADVKMAKSRPVSTSKKSPPRAGHTHLLAHVRAEVEANEGDRREEGLGFAVDTTVDPYLQARAEDLVADHLDQLRRSYPKLRGTDLQAALVAVDVQTGEVVAWVGGDPDDPRDRFDRVTRAHRQPGSTIKPLIALHALDDCELTAATLISDDKLSITSDGRTWTPDNYDSRNHGDTTLHHALVNSYNRPFVRIAQHCGAENTAKTLQRAGLDMPDSPPLSFSLGSVETTPLQLVGAYSAFSNGGKRVEPVAVRRIETPGGWRLERNNPSTHHVASPAAAYIAHDLLLDAVQSGTGKGAAVSGVDVAGKTGTTSSYRDAWFAGTAGSLAVVVWVGLDEGGNLGLTGGSAAAPLFRSFVAEAAPARPQHTIDVPWNLVQRPVDPTTGLRPMFKADEAPQWWFKRGSGPSLDIPLSDDKAPVIR